MNFEQQLKEFPKQFEWKPKVEHKENLPKKWSEVLVCGMGGSALPGFLLQNLLPKEKIRVHRDYNLPANVDKNAFIVAISYSGNTEEALSAYEAAKKIGVPVAAIASEGELEHLAKKDNTPFAKVPDGMVPRMALGYQFMALADLVDAPRPENVNLDLVEIAKRASDLAKKIGRLTPLFYASNQNSGLAYIAKIQINENAKKHAFWNVFPEINHNEMEGFANRQQTTNNRQRFFAIMFRDDTDNKRVQKRMVMTAGLIKENGHGVEVIDISNPNWYNKVIYSVLMGGWLSYYLARTEGTDPEPVNLIEEFKKKLK